MSFYKAIGAGIGEMVGFAAGALLGGVGAPIGAMLGSYVGEAGGQIAYGLVNGGIEGAKAELDEIIETFITNAQNTWEWVSGGFKRFYESLDRYKLNMQWAKSANPLIKTLIPGLHLLGALDGLEIPMPGQFFKVLQGDFQIFGQAVRAFFDGDNFNMQGRLEPLGGPLQENISDFTSQEANDRLAEVLSKESEFKQKIAEGKIGETFVKGVGKVVVSQKTDRRGRPRGMKIEYYDENGKQMTSDEFNNKLAEVKTQLQTQKESGPRTAPSAVTPATGIIPSTSSSSDNGSGLNAMQKAFLETVSFAEGTKQRGYNTWFGNQHYPKDQPDLSKYTINEIVELQKRFLGEGLGRFAGGDSAAVGKYQMTYPETFAKHAGLDPAKDKFTPGNQDRMALYGYIMKQGGVTDAEINASEISDQTIDKLAPVFASFPNLFGPGDKGKSPR